MRVLATASNAGLDVGLLFSAFGFGFRHGIDWDHIAAITDITSSQDSPRTGLYFGTLYAAGHAVVVFVIGVLAIVAGKKLPDSIDEVMGRVVGVTLLFLGAYVFYSLARYGRDFRMRSRWMLVFSGVQRSYLWAREHMRRHEPAELEHVHEHASAEPFMHHEAEEEVANGRGESAAKVAVRARTHEHGHKHRMPTDPFMNYGRATAIGIGMLHGIGAETPTQVLLFLALAGASGTGVGVLALAAFLVGLLASNSLITLSSAYGFLRASKRFAVYATVGVLTGLASLTVGSLFLAGKSLPAFFGG